jgi:predicted DCC family thiol-disulfide oxidoreductase YuxK
VGDAPEPSLSSSLIATLREFATADPRSLGLFRIAFGIFLLVDLYRRVPDYVLFYTNEGMLPNHGAIYRPMSAHLFSLYHVFSTRGEVLGAFAATALVYFLYTIGWKTRVMQALVLLLATSLHSRNIMLENGGDVVSNLFALWTLFLPVGRRFSVDAMLASFRETHEHSAADLADRSRPFVDRRPIVSLAMAAIVVNLAVIYYFNTIHKDGEAWKTATSVHYVLWSDRLVVPLGVFLRPWVPPLAIRGMTIGTLVIESSIALLLVSPFFIRSCRRVAALMVIALHCGFQTVGHFGMFSFVMMLHATLLMGPEDWDALAARMRRRLPRRVVFYDSSCGVCHQLARLLRRLDHLGKLRLLGNDDPTLLPAGVTAEDVQRTIIVTDLAGARVWTRQEAIAQILRALPFGILPARILGLPGVSGLAGLLYDAFAARRHLVSQALGYAACGLPQSFGGRDARVPAALRPSLWGHWPVRLRELVIVVFVIALSSQVLAENRRIPPWLKVKNQPEILASIAQYPRFFQGWSMFAPIPPFDDGKVVVDAVTVDGRHIDPLAGGTPVDFTMPPADESMLMTQFWYEFHDRIRRDANARYRDHFRDWLVNWQTIEHRPPQDRIVSFDVYWVWRATQPPFRQERLGSQKQSFMQWSAASEAPQVPLPIPPASSNSPLLRLTDPAFNR